jgi:hypothetical protein
MPKFRDEVISFQLIQLLALHLISVSSPPLSGRFFLMLHALFAHRWFPLVLTMLRPVVPLDDLCIFE